MDKFESMTDEEKAAYQKGYDRARLDMFGELEQMIIFYNENRHKDDVKSLVHVRTVLRSMKPGRKPWDMDAK